MTMTLDELNKLVEEANEVRDSYTVNEIIDLTKGAYGGDAFRRFFEG